MLARRSTLSILLVVLVACALGAASPAFAHKFQVKRALFLEPSGERDLQVIALLKVPSGTARQALEVLADLDHDGRIAPKEERYLEGLLASRALEGIVLWAGTATLTVAKPEVKLKREAGGPIELMLHGVAHLPAAAKSPDPVKGSEGASLTLAVSTGTIGDPLDLMILAGTRPVRSASRGEVREGSLKVALGLGDRVTWRIE